MDSPIESIQERIKKAMKSKSNMSAAELSRLSGIPKSSISQYLNGRVNPKQDRIYLMASALNVNEAWLMGYDVAPERFAHQSNVVTTTPRRIPLLISIQDGEPVYTDLPFGEWVDFTSRDGVDFALRAHDQSMIGARISENDLVFCRKAETVDNGRIAVVIIEGSATLRRFYLFKEQSLLILKPENPEFEDQIYAGADFKQICVLGEAIAFQSRVR